MTLYTRHQVLLILLLVVAAGAGLLIDHWRRARPDAVERLERLDRNDRPASAADAPRRRGGREAARESSFKARDLTRRAPRDRALGGPGETHARLVREAGETPPAREARRRPARPARGESTRSTPDDPVDLNRASAPELARLPGIGPALAARIVEARPFDGLDDLARVRGLPAAVRERVRPLLTAGP
jgi:hypothetical protein